ncbi:MAG: N-acetyl-gamma-glutamyl-phosphate reductase [Fuerstiella sp.]
MGKTMARIAILGATGYTALELLKILARHPQAEVTTLTTRQKTKPHISEIHPSLTGQFDLCCENLSAEEVGARADIVFCALPHTASMEAVPHLLDAGCRVVDLSADYRLNDPGVYEQWYGHVHTDPTRLSNTVYGLPELYMDQIPGADLVANPGCYTSTSILGLAPLLASGLIDPDGIIIDAKSGVSGAGRSPKLGTLYAECNESVTAYGIGTHRHTPEIEQVLTDIGGTQVQVAFNPHLMPMDRGILCSMYPRLKSPKSVEELLTVLREFYAKQPFIRVVDHIPATKHVSGTNFCDISVRLNRDQLVVFSATDNLIKGASGVAVQNMNLLLGLDQRTGMLPC